MYAKGTAALDARLGKALDIFGSGEEHNGTRPVCVWPSGAEPTANGSLARYRAALRGRGLCSERRRCDALFAARHLPAAGNGGARSAAPLSPRKRRSELSLSGRVGGSWGCLPAQGTRGRSGVMPAAVRGAHGNVFRMRAKVIDLKTLLGKPVHRDEDGR